MKRGGGTGLPIAALMLMSACTGTGSIMPTPSVAVIDFRAVACSLPHEWLLRTWRGWNAARGGDLQILPEEGNLIDPGLPHVGPWAYAQDIPMLWYWPGVIDAADVVHGEVTLADIAPTQAGLLGFDRPRDPDGRRVLGAWDERPGPLPQPRLLVTIVWDAVGADVLLAHPDSWPTLADLSEAGVWYPRASVGSSPTQTAQSHATIGTGDWPRRHGLLAHRMRIGGTLTTPWAEGPAYLRVPTLADLFDRARENRPVVGELGTLAIHLGLVGHGSAFPGGDRDVVALREAEHATTLGLEGDRWDIPVADRPYFRLPTYLNAVPGFSRDVRATDAADGKIDGRWRDDDIARLAEGFDTPARIPYQERALETMITREGFGADDVPDLLFVNFKLTDFVAHAFGMESPEMADALAAQDAALGSLVSFLDREVGRGRWALVLTADHGAAPSPDVTGGTVISSGKMRRAIEAAFDTDGDGTSVVELIQATEIYLNVQELEQNGHTLGDVAQLVGGMTAGEVAAGAPPPEPDAPVFRAAYPSSVLADLPCLQEARAA